MLIAVPLQHWLHESASMLRHTSWLVYFSLSDTVGKPERRNEHWPSWDEEQPDLCLHAQSVPRSKHSPSQLYKPVS